MTRSILAALVMVLAARSAAAQTTCRDALTLSGSADLRDSIDEIVEADPGVREALSACGGGTVDLIETDEGVTLTLVDGFGRTVIRRADDLTGASAVVAAWVAANAAAATFDPFALPDREPSDAERAALALGAATQAVVGADGAASHAATDVGRTLIAQRAAEALEAQRADELASVVLSEVPGRERTPLDLGWHTRAAAEGGIAADGLFSGLSGSACAELGPVCFGPMGQFGASGSDRAWTAAAAVEVPVRRGIVEFRPTIAIGWGTAPAGSALASRSAAVENDPADLVSLVELGGYGGDAEVVESRVLAGVEAVHLGPGEADPDDEEAEPEEEEPEEADEDASDSAPGRPRPPWTPPTPPAPDSDSDSWSNSEECDEDESSDESEGAESSDDAYAKSLLSSERNTGAGSVATTGPRIDLLVPIEFQTRGMARPAIIPAFGLGMAGAEGWSVRLGVGAAFGGTR